MVTLTFDDGPGPYTDRVLDLLAQYHLHATFCQIGEQVAAYPAVERRIAAAGDSLCNHTWTHDEQLPARSTADINSEIDRTQQAVGQATGQTPHFFRAPGGNFGSSPALRMMLAAKGLLPLAWSVDAEDWKRPGVAAIVHNVMSEVTPGAVILMHDAGGNRSQTLAALPILIKALADAGYRIVPMPPSSVL